MTIFLILLAVSFAAFLLFWCICAASGGCSRLDERPGELPDFDHRDHIGEPRP